jgi:hypothetical protein
MKITTTPMETNAATPMTARWRRSLRISALTI